MARRWTRAVRFSAAVMALATGTTALAACADAGDGAGRSTTTTAAATTTRPTRSGAGADRSAERAADPRPNIVLVMTDDQTLESMRVLTRVQTLVADQGVTFENSVVSFPLCCPSRATYLTGQYAHNHGVQSNQPPTGGYASFRHQETTLPVALERAGYDTIHIGKYLNGYKHPDAVVPPGWTEWYGSVDPSTYRYFGPTLITKDGEVAYGRRDYQTDLYTDLAVDAIDREHRSGRPFFLSIAFLAPHNQVIPGQAEDGNGAPVPAPRHRGAFADEPLPADPSYDEADVSDKPAVVRNRPRLTPADRKALTGSYRKRLESLLAVDESVGRLVATLERTGELHRTAVIFTSDNGFMHGEHRIRDGKGQAYEPSVRVPLVMRAPGLARGVTRDDMVANIDLAPTILDLADARPLRTQDGRSLVPVAEGSGSFGDRAVLLEMDGPFNRTYGVHTRDHVYIERASGERELYDLRTDPFELDNRADDPALASVRNDLARRLAVLTACAGDTCAGS